MTLGLAAPGLANAATFTVNDAGNGSDTNPGDGACTAAPSQCTLRAAIEEANALSGADAIHFALPGTGVVTITPGSALPPSPSR